MRNRQGEKTFLPAGQLVFQPGPPVFDNPLNLDPEKLATNQAEYSAMEKAGIIRRSNSPWSSPLLWFITDKSVFGLRLALLKIEQFLVSRTDIEIRASFLRTYGWASRLLSDCC